MRGELILYPPFPTSTRIYYETDTIPIGGLSEKDEAVHLRHYPDACSAD